LRQICVEERPTRTRNQRDVEGSIHIGVIALGQKLVIAAKRMRCHMNLTVHVLYGLKQLSHVRGGSNLIDDLAAGLKSYADADYDASSGDKRTNQSHKMSAVALLLERTQIVVKLGEHSLNAGVALEGNEGLLSTVYEYSFQMDTDVVSLGGEACCSLSTTQHGDKHVVIMHVGLLRLVSELGLLINLAGLHAAPPS
jgi:hypothetical protein